MSLKNSIQELQNEEEKVIRARHDLKVAQQKVHILESEQKRLTRKQRTHRLCTHGGMLEQYLPPDDFTDDQIAEILKTIFHWPQTKELLATVRTQQSEEP